MFQSNMLLPYAFQLYPNRKVLCHPLKLWYLAQFKHRTGTSQAFLKIIYTNLSKDSHLNLKMGKV